MKVNSFCKLISITSTVVRRLRNI